MEKDILEEILEMVKQKKELSGISSKIVKDNISDYFKKMRFSQEKLFSLSDKDKKLIVKEIRLNLRLLHGRFNYSGKQRTKLLEEKDYSGLLNTHTSTKERLEYYPKIKEIIDNLNITSVLDIGCGLNPIALSKKEYTYYYLDINEEELRLVDDYFQNNHFKGNSIVADIRKLDLSTLPKVELCLSFKILDILKRDKYNLTRNILTNLNCKHFLISFATRTISGKKMNNKNRFWFESIVKTLNYNYEIIEFENEIFYLISKS